MEQESAASNDLDDKVEYIGYSANFTFENHVQLNTGHYQAMAKNTEQLMGSNRFYLISPTASHVPSKCLHPGFYMECEGVRTMAELAVLLKAPKGWRQTITRALKNRFVAKALEDFRNRQNVPEVS